MDAESYLVLSDNSIEFEPVTTVNNVFFDEANRQIFTVRSGGATGVMVKGPDATKNCSFQLDAKGSLISIKFSYQQELLALQRSETSIEFVSFVDGKPGGAKCSQSSKTPESKIRTFHWISRNELVFVTLTGIEFYQINVSKMEVKLLKSYNLQINWSTFLAESALLLCHTSLKGGSISSFHFKDGKVQKLPLFQPEMSTRTNPDSVAELSERDVTMVNLYGEVYIAVLRHPSAPTESGNKVDLYLLKREAPAKKVYTLVTRVEGRFAISVIDNMVVIHHQPSKSSMIFDIHLHNEKNKPIVLHPVTEPISIRPHKIKVAGYGLNQSNELECQLYAPTWIVFQPNIIIDAALGRMWFLKIKLDAIVSAFSNLGLLMDFLLLRRGSKPIILRVLKKLLLKKNGRSIYKDVSRLFDKLNGMYKTYMQAEQAYIRARKQDSSSASARSYPYPTHRTKIVVDQSDMFTHVLSVMARESGIDQTHVCKVTVEYIRSLNDHNLPVQHYLYELIISALLKGNNLFLLQQYIQNGVIADSRMTAAHMLETGSADPRAKQLATDMFKRIQGCNDEVIDALLSQHKIMEAIRYAKSNSMQNSISARKFLEAAKETGNDMLFYEMYKFFEARNHSLRGTKLFTDGEQCDAYVSYFESKFANTS